MRWIIALGILIAALSSQPAPLQAEPVLTPRVYVAVVGGTCEVRGAWRIGWCSW